MATTTAYSVMHTLAKKVGGTVTIDEETTLNKFFSTNASEHASAYTDIKDQYVALGAGGHVLDCANDEINDTPRSPLKAVLYKQIPFAMVVQGDSVPSNYADLYRLKVTKDNIDYYFLKKIDLTGVSPTINMRDITDPALNPTPVVIADENVQDTAKPNATVLTAASSKLVTVDLPVDITVSAGEFESIKAAAASWYGAPVNIMSEIAICSGAEKVIGGSLEAVDVQLAVVTSTEVKLNNALSDFNTTITLGTQDALYTS